MYKNGSSVTKIGGSKYQIVRDYDQSHKMRETNLSMHQANTGIGWRRQSARRWRRSGSQGDAPFSPHRGAWTAGCIMRE